MSVVITPNTKKSIDVVLPLGITGLVAYNLWKKEKDYKKIWLPIVIVLVLSYAVVTQITKSIANKASQDAANKTAAEKQAQYQDQYGITGADLVAVTNIAQSIYHAIWDNWYENEDVAESSANQLNTAGKIKACCDLYQSSYGKSLANDISNYCDAGNINDIVKQNWF